MVTFPQYSDQEMARRTLNLLRKIDADRDEQISKATGISISSLQDVFKPSELYALRVIAKNRPSNLAYVAGHLGD